MKQRPILFNGAMVRALLDGSKTQTRRIVKPHGWTADQMSKYEFVDVLQASETSEIALKQPVTEAYAGFKLSPDAVYPAYFKCPFGTIGDQIWVRETWGVVSNAWDEGGAIIPWSPNRPATSINEMPFGNGYYTGHVVYAADGVFEWAGDDDGGGEPRSAWKPSIHMPLAASRITLEITSIRVERLLDISEEDAFSEGAKPIACDHARQSCEDIGCYGSTAKSAFRGIWQSTGGDWEANPWVWVIEFKRATA